MIYSISGILLILQDAPAREWTDHLLQELKAWILPACVFGGVIVAGYFLQATLVRKLEVLFAKTQTDLDDLVLAAIRKHLPIWSILAGIVIGLRYAPVTPNTHDLAERFAVVVFWISLTLASANLGSAFLARFANKDDSGVTGTSLTRNILRGIIIAFGALLILQNLGIQITPLLTALGVGSFAVALGIQPTLADVFAGIHITLTRHVRVGDFVILENNLRGKVLDIGWRDVRILDGNGNVVVVPNGRLAGFVVTNTHFPSTSMMVAVESGVSYNCNLDDVERIAMEVGTEVMRDVAGAVTTHVPVVRFHTFGDNAILFKIVLRVQSVGDQPLVIHETIKRLKARFDREGIEIPYPQRVVHVRGTLAKP
jgi:small-conductance mechanosensitive channel